MKVSLMRIGLSCQLGNYLTDINAYMMLGLIEYSMMHFTGEKGEIQWCTLIMVADQKMLDLAGSLLQTISRTQEKLGEMLKI